MSADETHQATILIVDDTPTNLEVLVDLFLEQGLEVLVANDGESALEKLELTQPDIILLDVMMPGMDGFETCQRIKQREATRQTPILFMTALSEISSKMQGFALGAVDYVTKPFQVEEVAARVETHLHLQRLRRELAEANELLEQRVAERTAQLEEALADVKQLKDQLAAENVYLREELELTMRFDKIVGESEAIKRCLQEVQTVAPTDATVLILGETGTGKEVFARAVHEHSRRKDGPMVKVNCAALPSQLVESELFGHEKGAFTGALERRIGRFELAHGGTIFLDEIGELPLELQAKLLRVLQEGEIERVGGGRTINVDVRVVAATNRDLAEAVERGTFREDLYYRINVFPLLLPALRERDGDIALLVRYFVDKLSRKIGREIRSIPQDVMQQLEAASWPGNVRELEHALERAVILSTGGKLTLS
ncbi:MAG: sigma-54-dependent Fis family transcriptional regulator, partial [Myxococcales bacterium]|nr:sigma-54-dependent Fis family transcriptional regulator [Myxococcales bacterium]